MHIQFAELPVFDQDRAKRFYVEAFACTTVADVPMSADGWRWIELKFNGADTALHFTRRKDETTSVDPVMVLIDADVAASVAKLKAKGVEIVTEPGPAPYDPGRIAAEFRDSEGNRMVLSTAGAA
ncbi:MAG TPA: VOC family protein [Rhizobiaceae bacterium]|nr:VOC family protein [Rhizobiaceae bacterium]